MLVSNPYNPFPVLVTERLVLRQLTADDAGAIAVLRSDAAVNRFIDRQPTTSVDEAIAFIQKINAAIAAQQSLYWVICTKDDNRPIGTICLFGFTPEDNSAETGYELLPAFQAKGIMTEALQKVVTYCFEQLQLQTIIAFVRNDNQKSISLLEKNNFLPEPAGNTEDGYLKYFLTKPV